MCLILVGVDALPHRRVRVLANRDEMHQRASAAIAPWSEDLRVVGGRDWVAGGSWMAARNDGRFVAITNLRNGLPQTAPRSRGALVKEFVLGEMTANEFLAETLSHIEEYAPFNLLLGDLHGVYTFDGTTQAVTRLTSGWHAISNGPLQHQWPKMTRISALATAQIAEPDDYPAWLRLLQDTQPPADADLPDTRIGLERERFLATVFITGETYGTRASTLLDIADDGGVVMREQRFGPHGQPEGVSAWHCSSDAMWREIK